MIPRPLVSLFAFLLLVVGGVILFHPRKGFFAFFIRRRRKGVRIAAQDALKILYSRSEDGRDTSLSDLIAPQRAEGIRGSGNVELLRRHGLILLGERFVSLTPRGETVAANLVRAHRLWELHLAEETGYDQREWHILADAKEHQLGAQSVERLSRHLGSPVRDPDGDPIPTAAGKLPESRRGLPITTIEVGKSYYVSHLEDEPQDVYSQLVDSGIYFGMRFFAVERSEGKLVLDSDGRRVDLPMVLAAGVLVYECEPPETGAMRLSDAEVGATVRVLGITASGRGAERQRFLDLGFVPGARVDVEFRSAGKDPVAYRVKSSLVALRDEQAEKIRVLPVPPQKGPIL